MPAPGGSAWSRGVPVPGWGGVVSQHALWQTPPWTKFLTHASENITLPQTSFAGGKNSIKLVPTTFGTCLAIALHKEYIYLQF